MDLEGIMLNEISQTEKDKQGVFSLIYGSKKLKQMNEYNKTETDSQIHMQTNGYQRGQGWGDKTGERD